MWKCLSRIAIEQTLLMSCLALAISEHAAFNLMFQKACDSTTRGPLYLGKHCPTEDNAEKETATLSVYKAMLNAATVCLVLMYAGAWSDSRGKKRKPLMILAIMGQIVTDISNMFLSYYWSTPSY
ncbi:hypothetical protein WDU94_007436 [Cyamophila willieti]